MARKILAKPFIPPNTCPHIDRISDLVDEIGECVDDIRLLEQLTNTIKAELEYIRRSNELLRTASKYWHDKATRS